MHRYRVHSLFVDAPTEAAGDAIAFWSAALGASPRREDDAYTVLVDALPGMSMEVQAVDDAGRYHLDIETDDVVAEVSRLVALGATEVAHHEGWRVLRAPAGHLLCVVPVQSDTAFFAANARTVR